jgi:tellurite resistance protein TerC
LSLVLVVIGAKMLLVDIYKMPTAIALAITAALIGGSIVLSLVRTAREADGAAGRRGWIPGTPTRSETEAADQK